MKSEFVKKQPCNNALEGVDMFGQSVSLTFRSSRTYNTTFGGIISLLCIVLLGSFFVTKISRFLMQDDPFFSMTKQTVEDD